MSDTARNSPCPCGSNRRYKDCHGAIGGSQRSQCSSPSITSDVAPPRRRASYRPAGIDWANLTEREQEECGALMERALKRQATDRLEQAAEAYLSVLARAPNTHDALHMLGAIRLRLGELGEARRLIVAAMRLRPSYPAIEHNLKLVEDAERALEMRTRRQPPPPIDLCERALPILVDLALRPRSPTASTKRRAGRASSAPATTIHLIQAVNDTDTEPGWLVRRVGAMLAPADLQVWAQDDTDSPRTSGRNVRFIDSDLELFPRGGCQIFVGIDLRSTEWIGRAEAERVVVICSPRSPATFLDRLRAISWDGRRPVDLVFPSRAMASRFGAGHATLPPPVEQPAKPLALNGDSDSAAARLAGLTIGHVGRNWRGEPPTEEAELLRRIGAAAGSLALYDASVLRYALGGEPSIRFYPRQDLGFERFLDSLDCLLFTPDPWWREEDGRELFSAMASGVPALLPAASIYAEYIDNGVDGLLYRSPEEAVQQLVDLRRTPTRIAEFRRAARSKIAKLLDPAALAGVVRHVVTGRSMGCDSARSEPSRLRAVAS